MAHAFQPAARLLLPARFWRTLSALLFLAGVAAASQPGSAASPVKVLGMTADLPSTADGWIRKDDPYGIILQTWLTGDQLDKRAYQGGAIILISKATPARGSFEANFAKSLAPVPELANEPPLLKSAGITVNGYPIRVETRCCSRRNEVSLSGIHVAIDAKDAHVFLYLVLINTATAAEEPIKAEFQALVRSLRIAADDKPFTLDPPADGGGLDGLFTHREFGVRANGLGGAEPYVDNKINLFDPSGLYSVELPKDAVDLKTHCQPQPHKCGTYRIIRGGLFGGGEIELADVQNNYGLLERKTHPFAKKGEDLRVGKADYFRVAPFSAADRLDGVWRYSYAASSSVGTYFGAVAVERTLTFTRDGGFTRTGWANVNSSSEIGNTRAAVNTTSDRPLEKGRYAFDGYRMTLTGEDGRTESLSIFRPEKGSDELLVINGANYSKQDGKKRR
jgi:hypothetical protein